MGDYGFRTCRVCGKDVLWEEAYYMRDDIVCCSEPCYDVYSAKAMDRAKREEEREESRHIHKA